MSDENPESTQKHLDAEIICAGLSKPVAHQQLNFALSHLDIAVRFSAPFVHIRIQRSPLLDRIVSSHILTNLFWYHTPIRFCTLWHPTTSWNQSLLCLRCMHCKTPTAVTITLRRVLFGLRVQHLDSILFHILFAAVSDWAGSASLISLKFDFNSIATAPALYAFSKLTTLSLNGLYY
jgi:hypothetical protein